MYKYVYIYPNRNNKIIYMLAERMKGRKKKLERQKGKKEKLKCIIQI